MIGLDFDNTIVSYDAVLYRLAREKGLIGPGIAPNKHSIRDTARLGQDGERHWQDLQALAYGPCMAEAELISGVPEFIRACLNREIRVNIVSHKTQYAARDTRGIDLREAAIAWMRRHHFFDPEGLGLDAMAVYFEPTRAAKVARIRELGCTHFIDDLEETFLEDGFPEEVVKILYRPAGAPMPAGDWLSFTEWPAIHEYFFPTPVGARLSAIAAKLLGANAAETVAIPEGGNSEVFRVRDAAGRSCLGKRYLSETADGRDRLEVEFRALELMRNNGIVNVPRPIASDRDNHMALYEFIEGTSAREGITTRDIDAAVDFLLCLAEMGEKLPAEAAPAAAEACFSFQEALANIRARLDRLRAAPQDGPHSGEMHRFLELQIVPMVREVAEWGALALSRSGLTLEARLPREAWVLSPSDFGFHNAIRRADDSLVFVDFEYFGWDDAAKMVADFLLHPAMDLSEEQKARFAGRLCRELPSRSLLEKRLPVAYPLFAAKWCLIMLNAFLPGRPIRPGLAPAPDPEARAARLARAHDLLQRVRASYREFPYCDRQ